MAERRMFSKAITDSETFLDLPPKTQMLYFHLAMHADDDGFVGIPRRIQRMVGATERDMEALLERQYVIPFDSGVCVIRHWRIHNYIQRDRYNETVYKEEKRSLFLDENKAYQALDTDCIQSVSNSDTQVRLGKVRLGKENTEEGPPAAATRPKFVPPEVEMVVNYCKEKGYRMDAEAFVDFYTANGWKQGRGKPIVDWRAAVRTWARREKREGKEEDYGDILF